MTQTSFKEAEFKALYEKTYAPFCIYAKRYIDDLPIREDIVSDVFVNLWMKRETIDFKSKTIMQYIKIGVKNSCLNYYKQQFHKTNYQEYYMHSSSVHEDKPPDEVYEFEELLEQLSVSLDHMPPLYKRVFLKCMDEEKRLAEVAEEMKLSTKTISRYNQKMIAFLRERLKDFMIIMLLAYYAMNNKR